jgi:hypothetical protein
MLAELAAANAAFGVIKNFISNGKELSGCVKQISDFVFSKEQLEKKASKKKASGGGGDLEEFMALEQIREKEEELKKIMIYLGRPGLWQDWQRFQAEARKSRRYQEKMAEKRKQELIEQSLVNLVHRGVKQLVSVIYLKKQLRLYLPLNTPPLRLLNAKRLREVNNFLNNPARLQQKHQDFVNTAKLKENLKQERIREKIANDTSTNRTNSKSRRNMVSKQNRKNKGRWTS